ncbi:FAD-dependent monooxygenase [Conexibacter arvalis]|uniref:2-polyprenyl-6-methoxyphenol hydroxylase-like FAD-dependent oxidoreductase n=1 Tax=Conexibacter arvalis TaxID=912552 RepID=A0A840I6Q0_9ACTN|nr:2-polyprenyl-6-methoxyphenol hydroxylase-like FAD-dependent oxidoreductase [Conexibacter arvalis]
MERRVVIAGGGPVGMWLACELRLAGVPTVVLEQSVEISPHSRALTVHPRTVETFALRGAHRQMLAEGGQLPSGHFAVLDERLEFDALDTDFKFTLTIPQARTTALLQERAIADGADVRRGHRFVGFVEEDGGLVVTAEGPEGEYTLGADYLVGCDGTRSTVRKSAGIEFVGTSFTALGALGDVRLADPPDSPVISRWSLEGTFMCVRLPDGNHRIAVHSPEDLRTDWPGDFTLEELRDRIQRIAGTDYGMHSPAWLSRYSNASRIASTYRKGRVLVAGDAAHQHMPAGGVGLNVGVQDAMNLGWKLAATFNGWAPESLLDSYHEERHPVGVELLEQSQAQTALFMDFTLQGGELRSFLARLIAERPQLKAGLTERLSGLHVRYAAPPGAHPLTGCRAPNLRLQDDQDLFSLLEPGRYVLIDFARVPGFDVRALDLGDAADRLARYRPQRPVPEPRAEWRQLSAALVRPDGCVAWASDETEADALVRETGLAAAAIAAPTPAASPAITTAH